MPDATWTIPSEMNDMNQEEPGRYVNISSCQYLVDLDKASTSEEEPNFSQMVHEWKIVASVPFLDSSRSNVLYRAFYVPVVSEKEVVYGSYNLLQRQ
jgi:alpha-1,2-mannosyltransferase